MGAACPRVGGAGTVVLVEPELGYGEPEPEGEDVADDASSPSLPSAAVASSRCPPVCGMWRDDRSVVLVETVPVDAVYKGQWRNQHWHGQGQVSVANQYDYEGMFHESQANGHGLYRGTDGTTYEGQWLRDKKHGYGVLIQPDGTVFAGNWQCDEMSGSGVATMAEGARYKGEFHHGMRHGVGKYRSDKGKYEGQFRNDMIEGQGRYEFASGRSYVGQWEEGVMRGHGTMEYPDGLKYEGSYEAGLRSGMGTLTWPDGRKYHGQWAEGSQHGLGVMTAIDGVGVSGEWRCGQLINELDAGSAEILTADSKCVRWKVLKRVHVRALPNKEAESVGVKEPGVLVKGNSAGDWLALSEEPGFIAIKSNGHILLKRAVGRRP